MIIDLPPCYINFSISDSNGQCIPGYAIEVKRVNFYGYVDEGLFFDIYHLDGTAERRLLKGERYGNFTIGKMNNIINFTIQSYYPMNNLITKEQFQELFGVERMLNDQRHFVEVLTNVSD